MGEIIEVLLFVAKRTVEINKKHERKSRAIGN